MKRIRKIIKTARGFEPAMSEEDVLGQIRTLLEANGARVYRAIERVPKCYRCGCWLGTSERGTPDISGYFYQTISYYPFPFWFEIKRPGKNKHRPAQIERIAQIARDGGCAAIVESWEEVKAELSRHGITVRVGL